MRRLTAIIFAVVCCATLRGQSNPNPYGNGIIPYRAYDYSKVGVVDLKTRHLTVNIPLLSFKQKGALPDLSVSFVYNSSRWESYRPDGPSGNENYWWLPYMANSTAAVTLGIPYSPVTGRLETGVGGMYATTSVDVPLSGTYGSYEYVSSINGPTSLVGANSDWSSGITLDGTGIAVTSSATSTKVTDKNGVTYNLRYCSVSSGPGYCSQVAGYIKDSIGNQITLNYPSGSTGIPTSFTDSIGRTFNYFSTVSTSGDYINYYPTNSTTSLEVRQSAHAISTDLPNIGGYVNQYAYTWVLIDSITLPNGTQWGFHYNAYGDLSQIDLPTGGTISYTWDSVPDPDDQTSYDRVVTSRTESDGTNSYTWHYTQWPGNTIAAIVVTDPNNNDTAYVSYSPCMRDLEVDYFQGSFSLPSYGGSPCVPSAANLLKSEYTTYASAPGGAYVPRSGYGVRLPIEKVSTWANGQMLETDYTYDNSLTWTDPNFQLTGDTPITQSYSTGSVKSVKEYDYGSSGAGALVRQTITGYKWEEPSSPYLTENLLSIPSSVVVQDGAGTPVTERDYIYDESPSYSAVSGTPGLNTTLKSGLPSEQVATHTYFNSDGIMSGRKDGRNNVSSLTYGCGGLVPYQLTNPLNQTSTLGCDLNTGNVTSVQDPNGASTGYTYTSVNDPLVTTFPDTGTITNDYHGYATPLHVTSTQTATPDPDIVTDTYFDGLGRATKVVRAGVEIDTQYDGLGRVISVSNPSAGSPTQYTTYSYDALGRKRLQCNPDNGTGNGACTAGTSYRQWSYNGNLVTFYDENRNRWQSTMDGLGRLTAVVEPNQTNTATAYGYNTLDNLTSVAQSGVTGDTPRTRSFSYNSLSQLITAKNPETGWTCYGSVPTGEVPNSSNCTSVYDGNGNLKNKTDARGVTTNYSYDELNRLTSKSYSGEKEPNGSPSTHPTPATCYLYDTETNVGTNTVGRLVAEWTEKDSCTQGTPVPSGAISWKDQLSYDPMGRLTGGIQCELTPCSASSPIQYIYDLAGNVIYSANGLANSQTPQVGWYPSYDSAGRLSKVTSNWVDPTHPDVLFQADTTAATALGVTSGSAYSPFGGLAAALYGINTTTTNAAALSDVRTYDNRARLITKNVLGSSALIQAPTTTTVNVNSPISIPGNIALIQVSCSSACGQVNVIIDTTDLGNQSIDVSGNFTLSSSNVPASAIAIGTHSITVHYLGDSTHAPSSKSAQYSVTPQQTTTTLTFNPSEFATSELPQVLAHVSCNSGCGQVVLLLDGNPWVPAYDLAGDGYMPGWWGINSWGQPSVGTHTVTANYLGNGTYAPSSGSTQIKVDPVGSQQTSMTLNLSSLNFTTVEDMVASVQVGCNTNCGFVKFYVDGNPWVDWNLDSNGNTSADTYWWMNPSLFTLGNHTLTASYQGNITYAPISQSQTFTVSPIGTQPATVTVSSNTTTFSPWELFYVPVHVGCNSACGLVQVTVDGNQWVLFRLDNTGSGTVGTDWAGNAYFTPGTHTVKAHFLGNPTYAPTDSSDMTVTVGPYK